MSRNMSACQVCAQVKISWHPPASLLLPLSIPRHLWSHINIDFVTGLAKSSNYTVILTVVDRFFKMLHLIHWSNSLQLRRWVKFWPGGSSDCMAYRLISSLIVGHSLSHAFGVSFTPSSTLTSASHLAFTHNLMDRHREQTMRWRPSSVQ